MARGGCWQPGLGRGAEAAEAISDMAAVARDYASVELDLETGRRSQRVVAVEGLLTLLEPLMIALLGGAVGGIVIAMYMPIFDLISKLT